MRVPDAPRHQLPALERRVLIGADVNAPVQAFSIIGGANLF